MSQSTTPLVEFAGGEVVLWDENGVLMIKVIEPSGDPVELTETDALELGTFLLRWTAQTGGRYADPSVARALAILDKAGGSNAPVVGDEIG